MWPFLLFFVIFSHVLSQPTNRKHTDFLSRFTVFDADYSLLNGSRELICVAFKASHNPTQQLER